MPTCAIGDKALAEGVLDDVVLLPPSPPPQAVTSTVQAAIHIARHDARANRRVRAPSPPRSFFSCISLISAACRLTQAAQLMVIGTIRVRILWNFFTKSYVLCGGASMQRW
ncbi:hypothetical protein SAMD00023378_0768 [Ralstonia sp. NT80]|nr:hypothetical protein SAMD00023378_0768 [Ralstonia sp. NT80]